MPNSLFSYRTCLEGGISEDILNCTATLDKADRPHLLLESKTHQFFYCWWENNWQVREVPASPRNVPVKLTVDVAGRTHFLSRGERSRHLIYSQGSWAEEELTFPPPDSEIIFFHGQYENDILIYYAVLKQGKKIIYGSTYAGENNTWIPPWQICYLPPGVSVGVWPGRQLLRLLAWQEKGVELTLSYFQYNSSGEEVIRTNLPGLPGPLTSKPVLLTAHGELLLLWSAREELALARSFDGGRSWEAPQSSPAFAPAEITNVETFAGPSNQAVALLKACGLSLEAPLVLNIRQLKSLFRSPLHKHPRRLASDAALTPRALSSHTVESRR